MIDRLGLSDGRGLKLMLGLYLFIGSAWALLVPPFEKPDEINHLAYVQYLAREGRLPRQRAGNHEHLEPELQQPPLYYLLAAPLYALVTRFSEPTSLDAQTPLMNPDFIGRSADGVGEPNFWLHEDGQWPPDLYALRLLGVGLGLLAVVAVFRLALAATGDRSVALVAAGLVAFLPAFSFLSSSVSNDGLAVLCGSLFIHRLCQPVGTPGRSVVREGAGLGLLLGVCILAKATLYPLLPLVLLSRPGGCDEHAPRSIRTFMLRPVCSTHMRGCSRRPWLKVLLVALPVAAMTGGWWFARNYLLYQDPLGRQELIFPEFYRWNIVDRGWDPAYFFGDFFAPSVIRSTIGVFGFGNIGMASGFYAVYLGIGVLSFLAALRLHAPRLGHRSVLYALAAASAMFGLAYYNTQVNQAQGRLLLHAVGPVAVVIALGLVGALRRVIGEGAAVALILAGLMAMNAYALVQLVRIYGPPG